MPIEQHPVVSGDSRKPLQIGNDDDRKFQSLRLVNRHQPHRVRCLIDLPFTLAAADGFKLFDVAHEVANHVRARTLESRREREQPLDVREPLCSVEVGRDHGHVLRLVNRKTK